MLSLEFDLKKHKILFEGIKSTHGLQQIKWSGNPFIIISKKSLDCTHGADHSLSKKQKIKENKMKEKVFSVLLNCKLSLFFFFTVFLPLMPHTTCNIPKYGLFLIRNFPGLASRFFLRSLFYYFLQVGEKLLSCREPT